MIRHYTSRAGDPHRHLHLQINARVFAAGAWRGHPLGRGPRQHRGDQRDRARRGRHRPASSGRCSPPTGYTLDPETSEIRAARAVRRGVQRPDRADPPQHRPLRGDLAAEHPGEEPGPTAARGVGPTRVGTGPAGQGRPAGRPRAGGPLERRAARPRLPRPRPTRSGSRGPDRVGSTATRPPTWSSRSWGAKRSAWNTADIRGEVEDPRSPRPSWSPTRSVRVELAEDITARAADRCVPLLDPRRTCPSTSAPSPHRGSSRSRPTSSPDSPHAPTQPARRVRDRRPWLARRRPDPGRNAVVAVLAGNGPWS